MIQTHSAVYRQILHPRTDKHIIIFLENPLSIKEIEIKTVIQPLVLCGCKTWPLISRAAQIEGIREQEAEENK
jgi:hypothetical protein